MNAALPGSDASKGVFPEPELAALFANLAHYSHVALAVSGGADSVALMLLVRSWLDLRSDGPQITILTVDHCLRDAAAAEAEWVKALALASGFQHDTLIWDSEKPRSSLQETARHARYDLMTAYCRSAKIPAIATAHSRNDQAETLMMRLARGSGLDGLSAMEGISSWDGIDILRPLLVVSRERIEAFLSARHQSWLDDPSNDDERYERVRIRRGLKAAKGLGLTTAALALSAMRLRRARNALESVTTGFLDANAIFHEAGFVKLPLSALLEIDEDIALRALSRIIAAIGGNSTPLRLSKIESYWLMMRRAPRSATLGGCRLALKGGVLTVVREIGRIGAASKQTILPGETRNWDGRFTVTCAAGECCDITLRALGPEGTRAVKIAGGNFGQLPRLAVMTLPSLWTWDTLRYVPFAEFAEQIPDGWSTHSQAKFANASQLFAGSKRLTSTTEDPS